MKNKSTSYSKEVQLASTMERHRKYFFNKSTRKYFVSLLGYNDKDVVLDVAGGTGIISRIISKEKKINNAIILDSDKQLLDFGQK